MCREERFLLCIAMDTCHFVQMDGAQGTPLPDQDGTGPHWISWEHAEWVRDLRARREEAKLEGGHWRKAHANKRAPEVCQLRLHTLHIIIIISCGLI